MVEAGVVAKGESDDELPRVVHQGIDRDAVLFQERGGHEVPLVSEELGALGGVVRVQGQSQTLEASRVARAEVWGVGGSWGRQRRSEEVDLVFPWGDLQALMEAATSRAFWPTAA